MENGARDVKRKALVKVFNRYATLQDGNRALGEDGVCGALRELGFFSVASKDQASQLIKKLISAMGGTPVKLDSFVLVMNTVTSARPAQNVPKCTEPPTPPPPPPPPRPPSPVSLPSSTAKAAPSRSPSPPLPVMCEEQVQRMHSKSEDRHEWRMSQRKTAYDTATAIERASSAERVTLTAIPPENNNYNNNNVATSVNNISMLSSPLESPDGPPPGWVERQLLRPPKRTAYYIPTHEPLPAAMIEVKGTHISTSPLTGIGFVDIEDTDERVQTAMQCVGQGWPKGSTPALHAASLGLGNKVVIVTDSGVLLMTQAGLVEHSVSITDVTTVYTSLTGYIGVQAREHKGLTWYSEGDYENLVDTLTDAASRRQGMPIEVVGMDCRQQIDDLVNAGEPNVNILPINVYVPDGTEEEPAQEHRMYSPETARDIEWLSELRKVNKTGFVVDAKWEERRYRISMAAGSLGDVKVGTVKKTLGRWVSLPPSQLRLFSSSGIELNNDEVTGTMMGLKEGEVFTLVKVPNEPSLQVQASPEPDKTACVTLTACTPDLDLGAVSPLAGLLDNPPPPLLPQDLVQEPVSRDIPPTVLFDKDLSTDPSMSPSVVGPSLTMTPAMTPKQPPTPPEPLPMSRSYSPPLHSPLPTSSSMRSTTPGRKGKITQPLQPLPAPPTPPPPVEELPRSKWEGAISVESPASLRTRMQVYNLPSVPYAPQVLSEQPVIESPVVHMPLSAPSSSVSRGTPTNLPSQSTVPLNSVPGSTVLQSFIANPTALQVQLQKEEVSNKVSAPVSVPVPVQVKPMYNPPPPPDPVPSNPTSGQTQSAMQLQQIIEDHQKLQMQLKQHVERPRRPPPPQPKVHVQPPAPQPIVSDIHVQEVQDMGTTTSFPLPAQSGSYSMHDKGSMDVFELQDNVARTPKRAELVGAPVYSYGTPVNHQASVSALHRFGAARLSPSSQVMSYPSACIDGFASSVQRGPPLLAPAVGRGPKVTPGPPPPPSYQSSPGGISDTAISNVMRHARLNVDMHTEEGYADMAPRSWDGMVVLEF